MMYFIFVRDEINCTGIYTFTILVYSTAICDIDDVYGDIPPSPPDVLLESIQPVREIALHRNNVLKDMINL